MATQELKYQFKVSEDGVITIVNRKQFVHDMKTLFSGKVAIGVFRKVRKQRSTRQNSFYWGITLPEIIDGLVDAGYERYLLTPENVHDMLKTKFLTVTVPSNEFSGEFITLTKDSKDLTTAEWMDYTTEVYKWCQEFLNFLPSLPNEQKEMDLL
jgi:hypothetical protein